MLPFYFFKKEEGEKMEQKGKKEKRMPLNENKKHGVNP